MAAPVAPRRVLAPPVWLELSLVRPGTGFRCPRLAVVASARHRRTWQVSVFADLGQLPAGPRCLSGGGPRNPGVG